MLVLTSPRDATIRCEWGGKAIVVFPDAQKKADALVTLFSSPEEEPQGGTISWPGEYDVQEISIRGIGQKEGGQVSYAVDMDGTRLGFLSAPLSDWSDGDLELLGNIDILVIPADNEKLVQKLVDEIDPRILVPVQNGDEKVFREILDALGAKAAETVQEYRVKGLPAEGREIVVLKNA